MRAMAAKLPTVQGFRFAGGACGIKPNGAADLGLIVADKVVPSAAVFTTNLVQAAPVRVARERLAGGKAQVALVNSGNANACTGRPGMQAALSTSAWAAEVLEVDAARVIPASTGVIGEVLQADKIAAALPKVARGLAAEKARAFSRAILTTDRGPKVAVREVTVGGKRSRVLAIGKGAGMIHPRMATTLAFVVTDANLPPALLRHCLTESTDASFNVATVDGETSTNDMILAMASGGAGGARLKASDRGLGKFRSALTAVLGELAEMIVADGEGANHVAEIEVVGAATDAAARQVAQRVATSALVKTALHGKDANWGRILVAAGMAGVPFDPDRVSIHVGDVAIVKRGLAVGEAAEKKAARIMAGKRYGIRLRIGPGKGKASYLTCDLGHAYVDVNAGYRS